jgi:hypothetical protein
MENTKLFALYQSTRDVELLSFQNTLFSCPTVHRSGSDKKSNNYNEQPFWMEEKLEYP